ncbi:uncharacterized protein LOC126800144 [Argentina anserina]|uniref:uncharacterized protein LOC126800144 n=1 Tax=Argentina anserina TaxID=57926 RepID=UPI0021764C42|nr:uncharacterized protein LOC126800144 [Potentilla anserina]
MDATERLIAAYALVVSSPDQNVAALIRVGWRGMVRAGLHNPAAGASICHRLYCVARLDVVFLKTPASLFPFSIPQLAQPLREVQFGWSLGIFTLSVICLFRLYGAELMLIEFLNMVHYPHHVLYRSYFCSGLVGHISRVPGGQRSEMNVQARIQLPHHIEILVAAIQIN